MKLQNVEDFYIDALYYDSIEPAERCCILPFSVSMGGSWVLYCTGSPTIQTLFPDEPMDHICRVRISTCSNVCRIASVHVAFCFYMHGTLHLLLSRKWDHASCTRTCKHTGDQLLDTKANWIFMNMKGTIFQPRVLQLNWDDKNWPHTANTPSEKIGECAGAGLEPTTLYKADAQTIRPPAPVDILQCNWCTYG